MLWKLPFHAKLRPSRCWLQFSLRSLLLLMIPMACCLTWLGSEIRKGQEKQAAIAWVGAQGGSFEDFSFLEEKNWRQRWFRQWFPSDVYFVAILDKELNDISPLSALESLRWLTISRTKTSDLEPLADLQDLRILSLPQTEVCDLTPLARLESLEKLNLRDTQVTDLSPLVGLGNLKRLDLGNTPVTDISPLAELKSLEELVLTGVLVSDEQKDTLQDALPNCEIRDKPLFPFNISRITQSTD